MNINQKHLDAMHFVDDNGEPIKIQKHSEVESNPKCKHDWKQISETRRSTDLRGATWDLRNFECQKCYGLKQTKTRVA